MDTILCAQLPLSVVAPLTTVLHSDSIDSVPLHTGEFIVL